MSTSSNLSNITFNGKPLGPVVAEEASNEMHEALAAAAPRVTRRAAGSKHKTFTNGISRKLKLPEPEPDFTQWVIIKGVKHLRAAKEPIAESGKSLKGALQYDPETDKIKCHECGDWFVNYGGHAKNSHFPHVSARRYKKKHGFKASTPLLGMRLRSFQKKQALDNNCARTLRPTPVGHARYGSGKRGPRTIEDLNDTDDCPLQIPYRIKKIAEQKGRTPTEAEMRASGMSIAAIHQIYRSINRAVAKAGLGRHKGGITKSGPQNKLSEDAMIADLLSYYWLHGAWPQVNHLGRRNHMAHYGSYVRHFGGLPQAIAKAESRLQA
jgi:hypothetical protein